MTPPQQTSPFPSIYSLPVFAAAIPYFVSPRKSAPEPLGGRKIPVIISLDGYDSTGVQSEWALSGLRRKTKASRPLRHAFALCTPRVPSSLLSQHTQSAQWLRTCRGRVSLLKDRTLYFGEIMGEVKCWMPSQIWVEVEFSLNWLIESYALSFTRIKDDRIESAFKPLIIIQYLISVLLCGHRTCSIAVGIFRIKVIQPLENLIKPVPWPPFRFPLGKLCAAWKFE